MGMPLPLRSISFSGCYATSVPTEHRLLGHLRDAVRGKSQDSKDIIVQQRWKLSYDADACFQLVISPARGVSLTSKTEMPFKLLETALSSSSSACALVVHLAFEEASELQPSPKVLFARLQGVTDTVEAISVLQSALLGEEPGSSILRRALLVPEMLESW
eukprot:TRINITY_DN77248_c0_g1_i1.p2 TRINITY_DN77248_c0_g1~~TRINITY_DN77248_c0_g1_i1.p2  ORF type:complete len:160 (-),score=36.58 TRINITY_DN77248_c0_g1_i1:12-491(-)